MGLIEDLLTTGPSRTDTGGGPPIGVPSGYVARVPMTIQRDPVHADPWEVGSAGQPTTVTVEQPPRYFEGDEWLPATLAAEDRAALQRAMAQAGLLKGEYRNGVWDDKSRGAYASLLEFANAAGLTSQEALDQWASAGGAEGPRAPLTIKVSSPEDLSEMFHSVGRQVLGRRLRPEEAQRLVGAYQGLERGFQEQEYQAALTGGEITEPPSPVAFARQGIREGSPEEAFGADLRGAIEGLLGAL